MNDSAVRGTVTEMPFHAMGHALVLTRSHQVGACASAEKYLS